MVTYGYQHVAATYTDGRKKSKHVDNLSLQGMKKFVSPYQYLLKYLDRMQ